MKDYAIYLPMSASSNVWQVAVTAAGFTNVRPGAPYPPGRHPLDHLFTWQRGRVLQSYQIIYIAKGEGTFEAKSVGIQKVHSGTVILLFPGVWHRYLPEAMTGWVESWIEVQGPAVERLEWAGVISPEKPLYRLDEPSRVEEVLAECHRVVEARPAGYAGMLAALGLQLLAGLEEAGGVEGAGARSVEEAVERLQEALASRLDRVVNMEEFAAQLGVNYSTLRHAFKEQVGSSPKQYHLQMRLRKACEFLQNTDLTIARISEVLGFASAFHLSNCFKAHKGVAPSKWREQRMEGEGRS